MIELWPNLENVAWRTLQDNLEPMISDMLHDYHLSGFKFNRLEIGKFPPRVDGVKVHSIDKERLILDIDVVYEGDLRFTHSIISPSFIILLKVVHFNDENLCWNFRHKVQRQDQMCSSYG